MGPTVRAFLAHFEIVKPTGGQYLVRCPGHDDRTASLAVKEGADGCVLLTCHAGCDMDRILHALGMEVRELFEPRPSAGTLAREIVATYDYRDEAGQLLSQKVRYRPKGFANRRPDGAGGWIYNLHGVRRVLYRLPDLKGHPAVVLCEGEKDVEAAALALGVPATCNPNGASEWDAAYAQQLQAAGVQRVAILPDNDDPGRHHANIIAKSLTAAGLAVRVVVLPGLGPHGDLSDYLASGRTKADLLAVIRETSTWTDQPVAVPPVPPVRQLETVTDQHYRLTDLASGVSLELDRLRRDRDGLVGELAVTVNGLFPAARSHQGIISIGDFNLASVRARQERAKLLSQRSGDGAFDWYGFLEEFCIDVMAVERRGAPAVVLADAEPDDEAPAAQWEVGGLPLLRDLPMVLFGDSSAGKSFMALWLAASLAGRGIPVLYADWEFSVAEHRKRLAQLCQPMPRALHYARCDAPLAREKDRLARLIRELGCQYVICDSIGFAVDGPAETHDAARGYFQGLRHLGVGSLSISHIPKHTEEGREATLFGSVYFRAGARSAWFMERTPQDARNALQFGLHHRKTNVGALLPSLAYRLIFEHDRARMERVDVESDEELVAQLPLLLRLKHLLQTEGPQPVKLCAESLAVGQNVIRALLSRHKRAFHRVGGMIGLAPEDVTV